VAPADSAAKDVDRRAAGFIIGHFRGDHSLARAWWGTGLLLGCAGPAAIFGAVQGISTHDDMTLSANARIAIAGLCLNAAVWAWVVIGIWRSANHHAERGGSSFVARIARGLLALGCATSLAAVIAPPTRAKLALLLQLARNEDPVPAIAAQVSPGGRTLLLNGPMGQGSAMRVGRLLAQHPDITAVHLNSGGGRVFEALAIARAIAQRGLDTYVEGTCSSACTIIFLAGRDRGATHEARLGFHRPSFAGFDTTVATAAEVLEVYQDVGLSAAFRERALQVPANEIWYPTTHELLASGVVTRVAHAGEAATWGIQMRGLEDLRELARTHPLWTAAETRFPEKTQQALETVYQAIQAGGTDGQAANALHAALGPLVTEAVLVANDEQLDKLLAFVREFIALVREHEPTKCAHAVAGSAFPVSASRGPLLPADSLERAFVLELLASAPRSDRTPPPKRQALASLRRAAVTLSPLHRQVLSNPRNPVWPATTVCDATLAFLRSLSRLQARPRSLALRQLYQVPGEHSDAARPVSRLKSGGSAVHTGSSSDAASQ
jgi:hypothetical protein